ncbi:hypothetical protein Cgig2_006981 [Carnegiea gigantea]|uniref:FAD linked oxidase N-terminal domain-containing protein n=1 Tax=Carnegiea gigantea TaxID=171969 RepID=A0A9Q1KE50_9CARY|nr:hypothetical protein Cgig2_006981 [Carnegiea gigantea]
MKPSNSTLASLTQNLVVLLFIFTFCAVSSSSSHIENFLDCLPQHSDPSSSISQTVYTPENPSFSSILKAYIRNLRFNTSSAPKPLAIVTPLDKSHVQASVICAKTNEIELRIRSGGHDYEGLSYVSSNPFVLLDMFNFRSIDIDLANETAWVQSGATLVAPRTDPNLFIRVESKVIREGKKTVEVSFIALYLGRASDLVQLVNKEFPLLGLRHNDTQELSWLESSLNPPLGFNYEKHKSDYVKTPIPKVGLEALWKKMLELENITLQFNPYGGKMGKIPKTATPFPHREGTLFKIQYLALWNDDSQEFTDRNLRGMKEMYDFMAPYVSKNPREAFLNYRDIDIGTNANKSLAFALDYFKENVPRLLKRS